MNTYIEWRDQYYSGPYSKSKATKKKVFAVMTTAEKIAWRILEDVTDRRGWRHEWDRFDDEVRNEIFAAFVEIVGKELHDASSIQSAVGQDES